jgi:hypothetical protein
MVERKGLVTPDYEIATNSGTEMRRVFCSQGIPWPEAILLEVFPASLP